MAQIKLTPSEVIAAGEQITSMGEEVDALIGEIDKLVGQINGVWEGSANSAYFAQYTSLKQTLTKMPELVRGLGARTVAGGNTWLETENALANGLNNA